MLGEDVHTPPPECNDDFEGNITFPDDMALACLEELYNDDNEDYFTYLTQHMPTSPPVKHTKFQSKSIFNPTHAKGPYVHSFYQLVYSEVLHMCHNTKNKPSL